MASAWNPWDQGIKDDEFYCLSDEKIQELFKNRSEGVFEFLMNFNFEKEAFKVAKNKEIRGTNHQGLSSNLGDPLPHTSSAENVQCVFVENALYELLSNDFMGKIVLGKFMKTKQLDRHNLVDAIVMSEMKKANDHYTIKTPVFAQWAKDIVELFPLEDPEFYYSEPVKTESSECVGGRGSLYNHYRYLRRQLGLAGLLEKNRKKSTDPYIEPPQTVITETGFDCLTDKEWSKYNVADVIQKWEKSFDIRHQSLTQKEKKKELVSIEQYLKSFSCLNPPLGITLLESDFLRVIGEEVDAEDESNSVAAKYGSLFSKEWPELSRKIVDQCKKSKIREVKQFFKIHEELLQQETHHETLSLMLLPLYLTVSKKSPGPKDTVLSKADIAKSFVLHVPEGGDINSEKSKLLQWQQSLGLSSHPYCIIYGKLDNCQSYVILNGNNYSHDTPALATEACFKCLVALRRFPFACDHVWNLIKKAVYKLSVPKTHASVKKLVSDLAKP